jgi:DNA-binding beta-propeller fold protein YncE
LPYDSGATPITLILGGGTAASVAVASAATHGTATASGTTISYTPATGFFGTDSFTYTATNATSTSLAATATITVSPPVISVTPTALAAGTVGTSYSHALTPSGGQAPYSFATTLASGALPAGLSLGANGTISGTPTASGTFTFTVRGTDSSTLTHASFTSQSTSLTIGAAAPVVPLVTGITPTSGPVAGGTAVTIAGTGFTGATGVSFGGVAATGVTVVSATEIMATAPGATVGTVDVTVTTAGGTTAVVAGDRYSYVAPVEGANGIYGIATSFGSAGAGNQQFAAPSGVAIDVTGHRLFVADATNNRVQMLNSDSLAFIATLGVTQVAGSDSGHFTKPGGVAFDPVSNRIFVADTGNNRVQVFDGTSLAITATIGVTHAVGADNAHLSGPQGLALDGGGNLLIADTGNDRVQLFQAASLTFVGTIGTSGVAGGDNAHLSAPGDVKVNPVTAQIWVADGGNNRVQVFDGTTHALVTTLATALGSPLLVPSGLGFDPVSGVALVSDRNNNRVVVYDTATARGLAALGGTGTGNGQFNAPGGVAADPTNNRVLIADSGNNRLEMFVDQPTPIVASVLPGSRSVQTGQPATVFATIINPSATALANCQLGISTGLAAQGMSFSYQTTNPATNALNGTINSPAGIAAGGSQSFLLSFGDTSPLTLSAQPLDYSCDGIAPTRSITGVNTIDLNFSATPIADVIALVATTSNDGTSHLSNDAGAFAVATANVGIAAPITAVTDFGGASLPLTATICQTNSTTGVCLAPPAVSVQLAFAAGAMPTFTVFLQASADIPFAPGASRVFVRFNDQNGVVHGLTSVAVTTN